jgi:hypothetical protein
MHLTIDSIAQYVTDSIKTKYNTQTILLNNGFKINGIPISKSDFKERMALSKEASQYYQEYLKARKPAVLLPLISFAAIIGGAILSRENNTAGIIMISSSSIFTITGALFARKSNSSLNLAIWHYNKDVLFLPK